LKVRKETSTPQGKPVYYPENVTEVLEVFQTCLAAQPIAFHKPAQDHRDRDIYAMGASQYNTQRM
jgi:hypothetical protein